MNASLSFGFRQALLFGLYSLAAQPHALANQSPEFLLSWGVAGDADGQFHRPRAAVATPAGDVYVADTWNHRIQKFASNGTHLATWGSYGSTPGRFDEPSGVAVDGLGRVYVADTNNHRIQVFDDQGTLVRFWGASGRGDGQLNGPAGLAADEARLYVADRRNHRIQVFAHDGTFLAVWGRLGFGPGQFIFPTGVAIDASGRLYVADQSNHRIQVLDGSGSALGEWGTFGNGEGHFSLPSDVVVDAAGQVFVADTANHRIQQFDAAGGFVTLWGAFGDQPGQFTGPAGLAVDALGHVFVADEHNHRIQKFGPPWQALSVNAGTDQIIECVSPSGALATLDGSGSVGAAPLTFMWTEGGELIATGPTPSVALSLGTHQLTLIVTDVTGTTASDTVTVQVSDTTSPVIERLGAVPAQLWPPNNKMVDVLVEAFATDRCEASPTCRIVTVEFPDDGSVARPPSFGDVKLTGALNAQLRAVRLPGGQSRTYLNWVECRDSTGNDATQVLAVSVARPR